MDVGRPLSLTFEERHLLLCWSGRRIVPQPGVALALKVHGEWLHSDRQPWRVDAGPDHATAGHELGPAGGQVEWRLSREGPGRLALLIEIRLASPIEVQSHHFSLALTDEYRHWSCGSGGGAIDRTCWDRSFLRVPAGRPLRLTAPGAGLPELALEVTAHLGGVAPFLGWEESAGRYLAGSFVDRPIRLLAGRHAYLRARLGVVPVVA